jgi:aspartate-semialdehyde dehydrogenase
MREKLKIGILGATGAAGLEFVRTLHDHPFFEITKLYASPTNVGKTLEHACKLDLTGIDDSITWITLEDMNHPNKELDLICSALPSDVARTYESLWSQHMPVISTTAAFRYEDDVPILITEVNPEHAKILSRQEGNWIAPGPNCTTVGLAVSLKPLYDALGVKRVAMSSYQSISGGGYGLIQAWKAQRNQTDLPTPLVTPPETGQYPLIEGNVVGYIPGEEEKVKQETLKILGDYEEGIITPANIIIGCQCVRVPTVQGHFETVFLETGKSFSLDDVAEIYATFNAQTKEAFGNLPSSPEETIVLLDGSPQPRLDVKYGEGMSVVIGRIEPCSIFGENGLQYQVLSNNLEKGAAKGMIQVAEYLFSQGELQ